MFCPRKDHLFARLKRLGLCELLGSSNATLLHELQNLNGVIWCNEKGGE